ncbi:MAG: DUF3419 family protein [Candidatus Aminicenantes bacterium]|nr:DUF3419 family protein [Candidatus Aminicenantes bacterium]
MKKSKLNFKHFNQKINYSSSNEDTLSELKALKINKDDVVLTITGSGARALDLLIAQPKKVISIDINPLQNYLLELKIAAIKHLSYEKYLKFLGLRESIHRIFLYHQIRSGLSPQARDFWDGQLKMIKRGILYQGRWERYFKMLSIVVKIFRRKKIKKLFTLTDIENQRKFCEKHWNTKGWKFFLNFVCHRFFWKFFFKDPGFYQYVPKNFPVGDYIYNSISNTLETYLAKENHFLSILILNKFTNEKALPIYLMEKNYPLLKENISRVEIVTDSLQHYLANLPEKSINKFSLSDISSFTSKEEYLSILESCIRVSVSRGLFCLRHFLVKRDFPDALKKKIRLFHSLKEKLARTDLSFAFTFTVGQIN